MISLNTNSLTFIEIYRTITPLQQIYHIYKEEVLFQYYVNIIVLIVSIYRHEFY